VRFWDIRESATNTVEGFQIEWLPPQAYDYITPKLRGTRAGNTVIQLEAASYVGTLPLLNGDTLRIIPRVGEAAFWRMLLLSEGLTEVMRREFDELARASITDSGAAPWHSLLARSFLLQLQNIEKNSFRADRHRVTKRLPSARGRVRLLPTVTALKKREPAPVLCTFKEKTYDTAEHRTLAAAAGRLLTIGSIGEGNRAVAIRWAKKLPRRLRQSDLDQVMVALRTYRYTGPRSYYIPALTMARLLLADAGIAFEEQPAIEAEAMLTNVRTLFEQYVRTIVQDALRDHGFVVEKRQDHAHTLFDDGTCSLIPDVLVSNAAGPQLILDAKYKLDKPVEESDYYQMATYLAAYGVKNGILIMPSSQPGSTPLISRRAVTGVDIHEIRVPLDNWQITEALLATEVQRLLGVT
jgi:5-methylcytosine-specific restriction endonuclease McrBC regulatory subunit McrC